MHEKGGNDSHIKKLKYQSGSKGSSRDCNASSPGQEPDTNIQHCPTVTKERKENRLTFGRKPDSGEEKLNCGLQSSKVKEFVGNRWRKQRRNWGEDGVSEASREAAGRESLKLCDLKSSPPKTRIETILRPNGNSQH